MDIKNLLFNIFLAGLTSYIISNLFFYFAKKGKKENHIVKEEIKKKKIKENKTEGNVEGTENFEVEDHKDSKKRIFEEFKKGVPYSEKEYEALNKFLDDLQLEGWKFLPFCGYIEVAREFNPWDMFGSVKNVMIRLDRVKGCLKIDNWIGSTEYRYRVNCEKIQPLVDRFNKTMGYEEEVKEVEEVEKELEVLNLIEKEDRTRDILHTLGKLDPKKDKGYLELEEFLKSAFDLGYKVKLSKMFNAFNLEKVNSKGKYIGINVEYNPHENEMKLGGQYHRPYEIEKEMREIRQLVQNFNNKVIINNTNSKEIIKEEVKSEGTQKKYPSHYYINGKNTIEIIKDIVNKNAKTIQEGIDLFNVLKYLIRYRNKNKVDDLQKARNHLDWLIKEVEEQELSTLND